MDVIARATHNDGGTFQFGGYARDITVHFIAQIGDFAGVLCVPSSRKRYEPAIILQALRAKLHIDQLNVRNFVLIPPSHFQVSEICKENRDYGGDNGAGDVWFPKPILFALASEKSHDNNRGNADRQQTTHGGKTSTVKSGAKAGKGAKDKAEGQRPYQSSYPRTKIPPSREDAHHTGSVVYKQRNYGPCCSTQQRIS
ncbi:MAG: hypothetical protein JW959_05075 [Pirellulales bacterium]|nr:hypothetical protein [Pirellulales bacterium]